VRYRRRQKHEVFITSPSLYEVSVWCREWSGYCSQLRLVLFRQVQFFFNITSGELGTWGNMVTPLRTMRLNERGPISNRGKKFTVPRCVHTCWYAHVASLQWVSGSFSLLIKSLEWNRLSTFIEFCGCKFVALYLHSYSYGEHNTTWCRRWDIVVEERRDPPSRIHQIIAQL